jgi:hypothetical protein
MTETPRSAGRKRIRLLKTALFTLLLILLFSILIETAWALRGHVALAQTILEGACFSTRGSLPSESSPISAAVVATFAVGNFTGHLPVDFRHF